MTKDDLKSFQVGGPVPVKQEVVQTNVKVSDFLEDYAKAFVNEANRVLPQIFERENLTSEEVINYAGYLLSQRIKAINNECKDWQRLKLLWIPSFIQFTLSCIGEVVDRDYGLKFVPVDAEPSTMTFEEAFAISTKIYQFYDKLQMVQDAMPRGIEGDKDVMMSAIIDEYVRTTQRVSHPSSTYVSAFWNMKLVDEMSFKALYRIQYDDVAYIKSALISNERALI